MSTDPRRIKVVRGVAASWIDGNFELWADGGEDVRFDFSFVRVPVAHTVEGEKIAENCAELFLPRRLRGLWMRADLQRLVANTKPLTAEAAQAALARGDAISRLNKLADEQERTVWTL